MAVHQSLFIGFVFAFGACVGSFLNVCIHRLPLGQSIVHPPSACPGCGSGIRFYDNIPIFSYLFLRGRCRGCGQGISPRYPLVELTTAVLTLAVVARFGPTPQAGVWLALVYCLVVITFIDLDHGIIPDVISLPGILIFAALGYWVLGHSLAWIGLGMLTGGGLPLVVAWAYARLRGVQGLGGGDVKLLALLGTVLGAQGILFIIFISSVVGAGIGLVVMAVKGGLDGRTRIPFGPFITLGALFYLFFGPMVIQWYLSFFLP